jgi:hypothetical protein
LSRIKALYHLGLAGHWVATKRAMSTKGIAAVAARYHQGKFAQLIKRPAMSLTARPLGQAQKALDEITGGIQELSRKDGRRA